MGILDNVERGLEKLVRGAFTAGSGSRVQPVEIASALRREMDNQSITLSEGRTLSPNVFTARLSDSDFALARTWGTALAEELCDVVIRHAGSQQYTLQGPVRVSFTLDPELKSGTFEVDASTEDAASPVPGAKPGTAGTGLRTPPRESASGPTPASPPHRRSGPPQPVLDIDGQRYSLGAGAIVLGRSAEADLPVDDTGVSRRHLEISVRGASCFARDLGSTNGSYVNGQRLESEVELADGAVISMGRTRITFRLVPGSGTAVDNGGAGR